VEVKTKVTAKNVTRTSLQL